MIRSIDRKKKLSPRRVLMLAGVVLAMLATVLMVVKPALAATVQISDAHFLTHFNLAAGQQPENITLEPDGSADVTLATIREVARVTLDGKVHVLTTLPAPAGGGSAPLLGGTIVGGIVRTLDGTLYFNYSTGTADLTGIWRLRPGPNAQPERIAALPANSFANGLALDPFAGQLYVADSVLSTIWRVSIHGGTPTAWASGAAFAPAGFIGANGIKVHNGAVWVTNLDAGKLLRLPIEFNGQAGNVETRATGLTGVDDFNFINAGDTVLAALNPLSELALVQPDGTHTIVLTSANGLSNPTSVAVRGRTVYIASAAYTTLNDPNLLLAKIQGF